MELSEVMRRRRMVRAYDAARKVPAEAVQIVLDAMLRAPSAGDTQGTSFLVLGEPEQVAAYWAVTGGPGEPDRWLRGMRTAPVLILVWTSRDDYLDRYAEPDKGWVDRDPDRWSAPYWFVDAGMASMAALLTAVDQGLGACFFGVPPDRVPAVRQAFAVPQDQQSVGAITLGYPQPRTASARPARRARRHRIHRGRWVQPDGSDA